MANFLFKIVILWIVLIFFILLIRKFQGLIIYQNGQHFEKNLYNNPIRYRSPKEIGLNYNDIYIKTMDGLILHGWLIKTKENSDKKPTVIFFHENAGNIGFRMDLINSYIQIIDVNFVIVAYRGYSHSQGEPSELGLKIDAISIIQNILKRVNEIDVNNVYIHGSSLGGAVAIYSLYQNNYLSNLNEVQNLPKIKGLIIQNTFTSLSNMVDNFYPILKPFKGVLLSNHWRSIDYINSITIPTIFFSSQKDEIVPKEMMAKLYETSGSSSKEIINLNESSHNVMNSDDRILYLKKIKSFIEKCSKN